MNRSHPILGAAAPWPDYGEGASVRCIFDGAILFRPFDESDWSIPHSEQIRFGERFDVLPVPYMVKVRMTKIGTI